MARLPALIDALARIDGRPRGSIDHMARGLREAGLIQTTKRGRGAAEMTARDAAALILGLYGLADASPEAIEQARALVDLPLRRLVRPEPATKRQLLPPVLRPLASAPTLLDGVAALIELAPLINAGLAATRKTTDSRAPGFGGSLLLERPRLYGAIAVNWGSPDASERQGLNVVFREARAAQADHAAYEVSIRVQTPVFITLHGVLFPPEASEPAPRAGRR